MMNLCLKGRHVWQVYVWSSGLDGEDISESIPEAWESLSPYMSLVAQEGKWVMWNVLRGREGMSVTRTSEPHSFLACWGLSGCLWATGYIRTLASLFSVTVREWSKKLNWGQEGKPSFLQGCDGMTLSWKGLVIPRESPGKLGLFWGSLKIKQNKTKSLTSHSTI